MAPMLAHFELGKQITIETDTLDYAVVGILFITDDSGEICPMAFYSQLLSPAKLNYNTHNKELLTIYETFHSWKHYLEGASLSIDMVTDHKNLEYFATSKVLTW